MELDDIILNKNTLFAHIDNEKKELLEEHLSATLNVFKNNYYIELEKIISFAIDDEYQNFIIDASLDAIYLHDIGKSSPSFQNKKMRNNNYHDSNGNTEHSLPSAIIFLYTYLEKINDKNIVNADIEFLIYYLSYLISRHHTYLEDFSLIDYLKKINELLIDSTDYFFNTKKTKEEIFNIIVPTENNWLLSKNITNNFKNKYFYVLCSFIYSGIVFSDFVSTGDFLSDKQIKFVNKKNTNELLESYNNTGLLKQIRNTENYNNMSEINKIRTDIFNEAEQNFLNNIDKNFFYLKAPCGAGKTNVLVNLMLTGSNKLDNYNKLFMVFPLNNLSEQTSSFLEESLDMFKSKDFNIKNSITAAATNEFIEENNFDYENIFSNYQFLNYPISIISHVEFFNILFGTSRNSKINLCQLSNSIIVLDEIQIYNNKIWKEIIELLKLFSECLNIKIIISSATLPKLDLLLDSNDDMFCDLLPDNEKIFFNPIFKNRVSYNYDLFDLKKENILNSIINIIDLNKNKKILIEFITRKSARNFYEFIKNKYLNVFLITSNSNKSERKKIIELSKSINNMILIGTQVIEAGVDIDFDIGLKNISLIDSEEQFSGRINRNNKGSGIIYFFYYDEIEKIYKNDIRTNINLLNNENRCIIENKSFDDYYFNIIDILKKKSLLNNENNIEHLYKLMRNISFLSLSKKMKLLEDTAAKSVFVESDDNSYLLEEYKNLKIEECSYSEKMIKTLALKEKISEYVINIFDNELKENYIETKNDIFGIKVVNLQNKDDFL